MGLRAIIILFIVLCLVVITLRRPHIGLLVFCIMTFIRPERLSYHQLAPFRLFIVLSLAVLIGFLINKNNIEKVKNHSNVLPCLVVIALCQLFFSPFAVYSVDTSWRYATDFAKIIFFCYLMYKLLIDEIKIRYFFILTTLGVSFVAIWGFQQHFLGNPRLEEVAGGNYNESNAIGVLFAQFAPIVLSYFFILKKKWQKGLVIILFLILCADVVFTQSRAALLGLVFGLFIFFIYAPRKVKVFVLLLALLASPLAIKTIESTGGYSERIGQTAEGEEMGDDRLVIWQAGIEIFKDHPWIGVGQQNFKYMAKEYVERMGLPHGFTRLADAHNTLLLAAAETGILGVTFLIAGILFYYSDIHKLKQLWKDDPKYSKYFMLLVGLQSGMLAFLIGAMFHSYPIHEHFYWYLVVPGLLLNVYKKINEPEVNIY